MSGNPCPKDLFGVAGAIVVEVEATIDASVGSFFHLGGAGSAEAEHSVLELVFVIFGKLRGGMGSPVPQAEADADHVAECELNQHLNLARRLLAEMMFRRFVS